MVTTVRANIGFANGSAYRRIFMAHGIPCQVKGMCYYGTGLDTKSFQVVDSAVAEEVYHNGIELVAADQFGNIRRNPHVMPDGIAAWLAGKKKDFILPSIKDVWQPESEFASESEQLEVVKYLLWMFDDQHLVKMIKAQLGTSKRWNLNLNHKKPNRHITDASDLLTLSDLSSSMRSHSANAKAIFKIVFVLGDKGKSRVVDATCADYHDIVAALLEAGEKVTFVTKVTYNRYKSPTGDTGIIIQQYSVNLS